MVGLTTDAIVAVNVIWAASSAAVIVTVATLLYRSGRRGY